VRQVLLCLLSTTAIDALGKLSDFIITIDHLEISLVLIVCITTCIANGTSTRS
jgi:hypothetical protein